MARIFADFDSDEAAFSDGSRTLKFDSSTYGHVIVKAALAQAQHHKCCYCEGRFEAFAAADVEHFRPKGYVQQSRGARRLYPGYYWLTCSWENLLYSCQVCNRSHKRNLFPLANQNRRAKIRSVPIARENALLIDPAGSSDPRRHIRFHQEVPRAVTPRGQTTIDVLRLDRPDLNDVRREKLNLIKAVKELVELCVRDKSPEGRSRLKRARETIYEAKQQSHEFSSMFKDALS